MLQLNAFSALQLAPFEQVIARRGDFALGDHALDDTETLDAQRLQVAFDLGVAVFGDASTNGVGKAGVFIKIYLFCHGKFTLYGRQ